MSARLSLALLGIGAHVVGAQNVPVRGDDPAGAARYFVELRAGPNGTIPAGARQAALAQMRARWPNIVARRDATLLSVPASGSTTTWTPIGPKPITGFGLPNSGRLNSIAIHPTNPEVIFVGGAQGGVWKTINGGASWAALTDTQCSLAMGSVVLDPSNPDIIYAGTGEQNFSGDSYYGCGVLKSVNGGQSWTETGTIQNTLGNRRVRISRVVVDKTTANTPSAVVMAGTDAGIFRSADAGATWTRVSADPLGPSGAITDLVADTTNGGVFYAANGDIGGGQRNGVYKSQDGGATWTRVFQTANAGRINLAISASSPGTVYAAIQTALNAPSGGALLGIWRTTNGGAAWTQQHTANSSLCSEQCWYDMVIAVDPTNPNTVYLGGFSLHKSTTGATTSSFQDIGQSIHVDHHAFAFHPTDPNTIFSGNDGGIFKSTNAGASWTSLNTNLELTQFYAGVSVSPTSATTILGGTQDNGTLEWGGSGSWPQIVGGDGGFTALDQLTGATAFAETQWQINQSFSGPRRRDAGAGSTQFLLKTNGINIGDRALFIPPIAMDPLRPRIVFFGTFNLYRSASSGDLWTRVGTNLTNGNIASIGVAPSDTTTFYVGATDGRLSYTHDLGATWTTATGIGTGPITDIAVDPRDARVAIIVQSGFTTTSRGVFRTVDGGATWTNLSFDLPNIPLLAVVLEPGTRDITIGTDLGVFTLRSGATSWTPVLNGLPNVAVYDLVFDAPRSRLIAATHGRGMFALDVTMTGLRGDVAGPGNTPPDGTVGALDAQVILAMVVGNTPPVGSQRYPNGDANCDGQVTALDALIVLRKVAGLNDPGVCVGTVK